MRSRMGPHCCDQSLIQKGFWHHSFLLVQKHLHVTVSSWTEAFTIFISFGFFEWPLEDAASATSPIKIGAAAIESNKSKDTQYI